MITYGRLIQTVDILKNLDVSNVELPQRQSERIRKYVAFVITNPDTGEETIHFSEEYIPQIVDKVQTEYLNNTHEEVASTNTRSVGDILGYSEPELHESVHNQLDLSQAGINPEAVRFQVNTNDEEPRTPTGAPTTQETPRSRTLNTYHNLMAIRLGTDLPMSNRVSRVARTGLQEIQDPFDSPPNLNRGRDTPMQDRLRPRPNN